MRLTVTTEPATEPVTLAEVKAHLRITSDAEDSSLATYIAAARLHVEMFTRRALVTQTIRLRLKGFPGSRQIELPRPPLASVTSVKYYDTANAQQTLSAETGYEVVADDLVGRIVLRNTAGWPSVYSREDAVEVIYVAGYGAASSVPPNVKLAVMHLAAHFYENRLPVNIGNIVTEIPMHVQSLLWGFRVVSF